MVGVRYLFLTLFFGICLFANAQSSKNYPKDYFSSPLLIPLELTGNFCTLRENHFHSGLDLRTQESEGLPVLAAADGFISRIKISPFGYGKAIYIDHPNGFTTVYGHLKELIGPVSDAVYEEQYSKKSFEVDYFPGKGKFKVKKGDTIALSGNSGGSSGPHLHFEFRDTKSEEIINPLYFGFDLIDTLSPVISAVNVYHWDQGRYFRSAIFSEINDCDTLEIAAGNFTLSARVTDPMLYPELNFQPYEMGLSVSEDTLFHAIYERFHFDQSKQINYHLDYDYYWSKGLRYQKLWQQPGLSIPFYKRKLISPLKINQGEIIYTSIWAKDFKGNSTIKNIFIKANDPIVFPDYMYERNGFPLYPQGSFHHTDSISYKIKISAGSIPDTAYISIQKLAANRWEIKGPLTPYLKPIHFSVKPSDTLKGKSHLVLCYLSDKGKLGAVGGAWEGKWFTASILRNGVYVLSTDLKAPAIKPKNIDKKGKVKGRFIHFEIKDDLSGIGTYQATIDGQWILMDYDAKTNGLTYVFDKRSPIKSGPHMLQLVLTDKSGNKSIYKKKVIF